jgi:hypothetical protein
MKKHIEAYLRIMKALEEISPEEVQKIIDQALAQTQLIAHMEKMAEKRMNGLNQMTILRRTQNNRYTNRPIMGAF